MRILFLSTWFPYPPSQGSKIRAYHLLRALARRHEVALISFADTPIESASLNYMRQFCQLEIIQHDPFEANRPLTSLGWLSLQPSAVVTSRSAEMAAQVRRVASVWQPARIIALTFVTAPYVLQGFGVPKIVDVDNFLTRMLHEAYAQTNGLGRIRRWLAWQKFQRYEKWLFRQFDLCLVVSRRDRQDLLASISGQPTQIGIVPNGVDTIHYHPGLAIPEPNTLIFNGALSYQANYEAIDYFLREIFPMVQAKVSDVQFRITGKTENVQIARLRLNDKVTLTGYLQDIRPAVARSWACVVPLLTGAGTRLKILEAMALGTPVISTSKGAEGLDVVDGEHLLIADTSSEFAAQTVRLLLEPHLRTILASNARRLMEERYEWTDIGQRFCDLVEHASSTRNQL